MQHRKLFKIEEISENEYKKVEQPSQIGQAFKTNQKPLQVIETKQSEFFDHINQQLSLLQPYLQVPYKKYIISYGGHDEQNHKCKLNQIYQQNQTQNDCRTNNFNPNTNQIKLPKINQPTKGSQFQQKQIQTMYCSIQKEQNIYNPQKQTNDEFDFLQKNSKLDLEKQIKKKSKTPETQFKSTLKCKCNCILKDQIFEQSNQNEAVIILQQFHIQYRDENKMISKKTICYEMDLFTQNELEYFQIAQNESEQFKIAQNQSEQQKIAQNKSEWQKITQNQSEQQKIAQNQSEWQKITQNQSEWQKIAQNQSEWQIIAQNESEQLKKQELPKRFQKYQQFPFVKLNQCIGKKEDQLLNKTGQYWTSSMIDGYANYLFGSDEIKYFKLSKIERECYQRLFIFTSDFITNCNLNSQPLKEKWLLLMLEKLETFKTIQYQFWLIYQKIAFIVNKNNSHWYMISVNLTERYILVYDSLKANYQHYQMVGALLSYLFYELQKNQLQEQNIQQEQYQFKIYVKSNFLNQNDSYSCGQYTCIALEYLSNTYNGAEYKNKKEIKGILNKILLYKKEK